MLVIKALQEAKRLHNGQKRRSGEDYIVHPILVSEFVRKFKDSVNISELVSAALLHDVLEDTDVTEKDLEASFPPLVCSLVKELTSEQDQIDILGKNPYLIQKMLEMSSYALVIKLCDRLANVLDNPRENYLRDTRVMTDALLKKRNLSNTQISIISEIQKVLKENNV